jgi:hypothetical protein
MIDFNEMDTTKEQYETISQIVKRFAEVHPSTDRLSLNMDLEVCLHNNLIDLETLNSFDFPNMAHDLFGIRAHMDRRNGKLRNCFLPRSYRS